MKIFDKVPARTILILGVVIAVAGLAKLTMAATTTVNLGSSDNFAVLAGSALNDANPSVVIGDIGLSPSTGAGIGPPCAEVTGTIYSVDAAGPLPCRVTNDGLLTTAKNDLTTAYNDAAARTVTSTIGTDLAGASLTDGVYTSASGTFGITGGGTVTLNGQGNSNSVFIFKMASTLITSSSSKVVLTNGAQACNVFWQVGTSATLGTSTSFAGNIMADQSITDNGGSTVDGRLLARIAAVTLNNTHVTKSTCVGTINVVKTVINDSGVGTKSTADFPLFVNGTPVTSGVTNSFSAPGTYTVTETTDSNYVQTFSGDCDGSGNLSLNPSANLFCIITNNDIAAPIVPIARAAPVAPAAPVASAAPPVPPLIDVVKIPSPLSLPGGPGPVTYTYTLSNIGTVSVANITMVGDTCSPITIVSGDINSNSILEVSETWIFRCTTTLSATHTNTVVTTGTANGITATDITSATVVIGSAVVPPLIHVVKKPSVFVLLASGGEVTYTYIVTNPGTAPLSDVSITDNKCTGLPGRVVGHPGDLNKNDLLESNETWTFTCQTNLTQTTTNTGTAEGSANGLTARDFALATVVVAIDPGSSNTSTPGLPNTGFASEAKSSLWNMSYWLMSSY